MMAPTHVFASLLFSSPLLFISPESAPLIFIAAIIGGFFPDLDLLYGVHRKTLHLPVAYLVLAVVLAIIAFIYTIPFTVGLAALAIGVCSHVFGDLLGAGLEHEPWKQTSDKGVYNHMDGEWIAPTFILGHDGSLKDLLVLLFMAPFIAGFYSEVLYIKEFVVVVILLAVVYSVTRKVLPTIEEHLYKNTKIGRYLLTRFLYAESEAERPWESEK